MSEAKYSRHYRFARAHTHIGCCETFIRLATLYARHPDVPTLGLIEGCAKEVEAEMAKVVFGDPTATPAGEVGA